jgi:ComF family protein
MSLLDLLAPPACAGCGSYGSAFCDRCRTSLRPAGNPADRFIAPDPAVVVGDALEVAVAAFTYEGALRKSLSRLKYGGASRVASLLAESAAPRLEALLQLAAATALVPVPVHVERLRTRGYNQAELLALALGRHNGLTVVPALLRQRPTTQQHRLDRAARLRNLRDAFAAAPDARAPPAVILVDDILTTSATLEACATVLRAAGSSHVYGFAIAREV